MVLRYAIVLPILAIGTAVPALAQDYPREPPSAYMARPPAEWDHQDSWRKRSETERHAVWEQRRQISWRCDHGDREACRALHEGG
jgi:hypothetical protein